MIEKYFFINANDTAFSEMKQGGCSLIPRVYVFLQVPLELVHSIFIRRFHLMCLNNSCFPLKADQSK